MLAFVFPGQGAQKTGMGQALYNASPAARSVLDQAEHMMPGLLEICISGPLEALTRTETAQPALFAVETACAQAAKEAGLLPHALAGFSLGEWTACHVAGMLPFEEAFSLVMRRGEWMARCAEVSPGGMLAVLRPEGEALDELLKAHPRVSPANYNAPGQTVIAGPIPALDALEAQLKATGGRAMRLNVSGAFHTAAMKGAGEQLLAALNETRLAPPNIPVYSNLTALPYEPGSAARTLAAQAHNPVRWADTLRNMAGAGVTAYLELGPGTVLSGLIRKTLPDAAVFQAEDVPGIQKAAEVLGRMA
jgi:[acyl-carrier-protein] S-malonyltransferase